MARQLSVPIGVIRMERQNESIFHAAKNELVTLLAAGSEVNCECKVRHLAHRVTLLAV